MKIYKLGLFVAISFISFSSFSQSLTNKTTEELELMKKEAISSENYDMANKISEEQKSRLSIDDKIKELDKNLKIAVANENFDESERLKKEIKKLEDKKAAINKLEEEKKAAILVEDFDKVIALEKQIKELKNGRKPETAPIQSSVNNTSQTLVQTTPQTNFLPQSPQGSNVNFQGGTSDKQMNSSKKKSVGVVQTSIEVSPNGDGVNDFLVFQNLEQYPNNNLVIMYKSNIIYKTDNYQNNWGGETQPAGSYYYNLRTKGMKPILKGTITLIK